MSMSGSATTSATQPAEFCRNPNRTSSSSSSARSQKQTRRHTESGTRAEGSRHRLSPRAVRIPICAALFFLFWMLSISAAMARGGRPSASSTSQTPLELLRPTPVQFAPEERAALRGAFLRKFGLQALEPVMNSDGKRHGSAKVPAHIWALYERHRARPEADIVRHYAPVAKYFGQEDGSGTTMWWMVYNLSATGREPEREQIVRAELHLPETAASSLLNGTARVHKVNAPREQPKYAERGIVFSRERGGTAQAEIGTILRGHDSDQLVLALVLPSDMAKQYADAAPALIVYADEEEERGKKRKLTTRKRRRAKRLASEEGDADGRVPNYSDSSAGGNTSRQRKHRRHRKAGANSAVGNQCRRSELYVDFGQLNWHDWIMAPSGYEAYQCRGRCTHPMPSHLNTTNHAIVQSLIHSIDPSAVAAPSCVPVKMSAISILYKDVNNVIVVKTYADMRVDACGCH